MAFYSYLSTKIIIAFITKSYKDLFGVRSYINAYKIAYTSILHKKKGNNIRRILLIKKTDNDSSFVRSRLPLNIINKGTPEYIKVSNTVFTKRGKIDKFTIPSINAIL